MLTLHEATIARAWNLQGDPSSIRLALPGPNQVARANGRFVLWLGPRSWLVLGERLDTTAGVAFDVSASRVAWTLRGAQSALVVNKHCPLDLRAPVFPNGTCAQSVFGQVNVLLYRHVAGDAFTLMVARSFARDVQGSIESSAAQYDCTVLAPRPFAAD
jgi:heterotetrameric sarcosine oxidase gamma subunit